MRSIVFRFEDPQVLSLALDAAMVEPSPGIPMPAGQGGSSGEWILALFEVGSRRRSTASAARVISGEGGLRVVFESRDIERLLAFCAARSEAMKSPSTPESTRVQEEVEKAPFQVTLSGRFKAASVQRVLVADTDANTETLIKDALASLTIVVDVVTTTAAAMDFLSSRSVSLWVVGVDLEDGSGLDAIRRARVEAHLKMPILVVAKAPDSRLAVRAFSAGATDFIAHPFRVSELAARTVTLLSHAGVSTP